MSLADWTSLKTSLGDWLHRGDQTSIAGDLITLFEAEFSADNRLRQMEQETSITSTSGYLVHPTDWKAWKVVKVTYNGATVPLPFVSDETATENTVSDSSSPARYAVVTGSKTYVYPSQHGGTFPTTYYQKLPALSASQTTNWLLTNFPNVYLYGCLSQAEAYNINDERVPRWKQLYHEAIERLRYDSQSSRYAGAMQMRVDTKVG